MRLRVLIADDEAHGRAAVHELIDRAPDFEVAAECASGDAALATLRRGGIDVAFLDIRMPEMDGMEVARALGSAAPALVFVTAYDQHAVAAFEQFAVDYVLKPIDPARFERTLARVRERSLQATAWTPESLERLAARFDRGGAGSTKVAIQTAGRTVFLDIDDFGWATAERNYVSVHTVAGERYTLRTTLRQLEQELQACAVLRIHRAHLVSLRHVRELRSSDGGNSTWVRLRDGTELPVGRTYRVEVMMRLLARE